MNRSQKILTLVFCALIAATVARPIWIQYRVYRHETEPEKTTAISKAAREHERWNENSTEINPPGLPLAPSFEFTLDVGQLAIQWIGLAMIYTGLLFVLRSDSPPKAPALKT